MTQYWIVLIYSLLLSVMTSFRNSIRVGTKFYYRWQNSIRWNLGKSVQIEDTWVWSTQRRTGVVRHGDSSEDIGSSLSKVENHGEKMYRSETPFTKLWCQAWENWIWSRGKKSKGNHWCWRRIKVSVTSGMKKASVRKETVAVSATIPKIVRKNQNTLPPHLPSQPFHEVEVCGGREVSEANVTMGPFFDNRVDIIWKVPARERLVWCIFVCHLHLTFIICCTAVWAPACGLDRKTSFVIIVHLWFIRRPRSFSHVVGVLVGAGPAGLRLQGIPCSWSLGCCDWSVTFLDEYQIFHQRSTGKPAAQLFFRPKKTNSKCWWTVKCRLRYHKRTLFSRWIKGRSPTMRHVSRTHRVALDWPFDSFDIWTSQVHIKYVDTKNQLADMLKPEVASRVMNGTIFFVCKT